MKRKYTIIYALMALLLIMAGCKEEHTTYKGPNYVMFSDSLYVLPVQNNEEYFDIPVAATQACTYDRTIAVEIIDKESNAIEGLHYTLMENTVTIKAGERVANVRVRGLYDNIAVTDSLGFTLRLVTEKDTQWDMYGTDANIILRKTCPFNIYDFEGYIVLNSTYLYDYTVVDKRLVRAEVDTEEENTIIVKDYFYDGYDVKLKFTTKDPLNPLIEMEEQVFGPTDEAFGTIYGDGKIRMLQPNGYTSYYSSCEGFVYQYMTLYVMNPDESIYGTVGTFINVLKWITDDEAEKLKREGY
ncbi:MAG: DUF4984 domain-containing protein [Bacteroidaceae bacterium]|nr:DUF4984 domain-containing protein [Bacteroidaceae bacterium]